MGQGSESIGWDDGEDGYEESFEESLQRREHQAQLASSRAKTIILRIERYKIAEETKVGLSFVCPACGKKIVKRSYQHRFCRNKGNGNCKDRYWNSVDPIRSERCKFFQ